MIEPGLDRSRRAALPILATLIAVLSLSVSVERAAAEPIPITSFTYDFYDNPRHVSTSKTNNNFMIGPTDSGNTLRLAGAHANVLAYVNYCEPIAGPSYSCPAGLFTHRVHNLAAQLSPGMLGNAANAAQCPGELNRQSICKGEKVFYGNVTLDKQEETSWPNTATKMGYSITTTGTSIPSQIIAEIDENHVATQGDEPARISTTGLGGNETRDRLISVRNETDFGLDTEFLGLDQQVNFLRQVEVVCAQVGCPDSWQPGRPYYWTNPTSCYRDSAIRLRINSIKDSTYSDNSHSVPITDCAALTNAYDPATSLTPIDGNDSDGQTQAGRGVGARIEINVPEHSGVNAPNGSPRVSSHLYRAEVKLPEGMTFSTNATKTLAGCTNDQFGIDPVTPADVASGGSLEGSEYDPQSPDYDPTVSPQRPDGGPAHCPEASQIGTVSVEVPLVDGDPSTPSTYFNPVTLMYSLNGTRILGGKEPLQGKVFFGQPDHPGAPTKQHPWHTLIAIDGAGVHAKLSGDVYLEGGQIVSVFDQQPQTPFTNFTLNFNGGDNAVLQAPRTCGTNTMEMKLTPWSALTAPAPGQPVAQPSAAAAQVRTASFDTVGCHDSFSPTASGENTPKTAGSFTRSVLRLDRSDDDDLIKALQIKLPPGLVGSLTVPHCEVADLEADNCPQSSKVGKVRAKVGTGGDPLTVDGSLYLAKPSRPGDVATVGSVIPAKVGPIDLGAPVITKNHVTADRTTAALTVNSEDIPASRDGILLPVREIAIDLDRAGFFRNASSCQLASVVVDFTSQDPDDPSDTKTHSASFSDAAIDCDRLSFAPKLDLTAGSAKQDQTGLRGHPALDATVTQGEGEANISQARVVLPDALRPDTKNINKPGIVCLPAQYASDSCPPSSIAGSATATSPLVPQPLSGPVYLIQQSTGSLPDLSVRLGGMVNIDLLAGNELQVPNTINTFRNLPDVPQSSFKLHLDGGTNGILLNFFDLCTGAPEKSKTGDAAFTAHSGATSHSTPRLKTLGCERVDGLALVKRIKLLRKKGVVRVTMACPGGVDCLGKLTVKGAIKRRSRRKSKVAGGRYDLLSGSTDQVELRLSRRAKRALRKIKRPRLSAVVSRRHE